MIELSLIHDGKNLPVISHGGKTYFHAPESGEYTIRVRNRHHGRILAVLTVDGINIVKSVDTSGDIKPATFNGSGYVIDAYATVTIKGWLQSNDRAAAFEFSAKDDSYSAKMGAGKSFVGYIGAAVFKEKEREYAPQWRSGDSNGIPRSSCDDTQAKGDDACLDFMDVVEPICAASPAYSAEDTSRGCTVNSLSTPPTRTAKGIARSRRTQASQRTKSVGTGYGESVAMNTVQVEFKKAGDSPDQVMELRYGTTSQLKGWGVPMVESTSGAFPGESSAFFCPPPPGIRR